MTRPQIAIANPIYREVIPRMVTWPTQNTLSHQTQWYISEETGLLDIPKLLAAFQQFFRENCEHWSERFQYKEAGPQLLLQIFRAINGGCRIERVRIGTRPYRSFGNLPYSGGVQNILLELKI